MTTIMSFGLITVQSTPTVNAILAANLSSSTSIYLTGQLTLLPYPLCWAKTCSRSCVAQSLVSNKGSSKIQSSSNFFSPNKDGKYERGELHASSDEQVFISPKGFDATDKNLDMGVASSWLSKESPIKNGVILDKKLKIFDDLKTIYLHLLASEYWNAASIEKCNRVYAMSGTNLVHYLALKCLNLDQLNADLISIGLLTLDVIIPYVLPCLTGCIQTLDKSLSNSYNGDRKTDVTYCQQNLPYYKNRQLRIEDMRKQSSRHRERLLGTLQGGRTTHIMVTVGQEALKSQSLIPDILTSGATVVRINCAHGNPAIWSEIIDKVRKSSQELEKPCRILMDLAGPKLRTEMIKASPSVMKISPKKADGVIISPAQLWLSCKGAHPPAHLKPDAVLYIDNEDFLNDLKLDDVVRLCDARGKKRKLKISIEPSISAGVMAECRKTAYVLPGSELHLKRKQNEGKHVIGNIVDITLSNHFVRVKAGDQLIISRSSSIKQDKMAAPSTVNHITCSSGYLFDSVKPGETIAFDDGKISGVIKETNDSEIVVSINRAGPKGTKLSAEKSINIPDSYIKFEGLTSKDVVDLKFVASKADMVGVSFIRGVRDIVLLFEELQKLKAQNLGIVLKIETNSGFEKLPLLLLESMKRPNPLGVMIARGDLAVECGWERLACIQEEILATCSAAHIPVIWATQVLESLVKSRLPTRAEITDVGAGSRASCIMLNKGKNIREAVSVLDAILRNKSSKVRSVMSSPLSSCLTYSSL